MKRSVYIETTIPSYYCDQRDELRHDIARTREWWERERHEYNCFTSAIVLEELSQGDYPQQVHVLEFVSDIPVLELTEEVAHIAEVYQAQTIMPKAPVADALHLAIASVYKIDFLLTWNCRHLANANKFAAIETLNLRLGLHVPRLVTPWQLQPIREDE